MFDSKRKSGFTLVELLVVMIIISMLVGLAIPAVMMARERARRLQCANNLRNLGGALQEYELAKKQYPGWINKVGSPGAADNSDGNLAASWPVTILKNIGRSDIYDFWREGTLNVEASMIQVSTFICPSSGITGDFPLSYVANCGQQDANLGSYPSIPPDWTANGVFFRHYHVPVNPPAQFVPIKLASTDIVDGLQYTLLLSENLQAGNWANIDLNTGARTNGNNCERLNGMVWWLFDDSGKNSTQAAYTKSFENLRINRGLDSITGKAEYYKDARPSSYHPGGVNAVFCDGHSQFLDEQMEYRVYAMLMATDDKNTKYAGQNAPVMIKDPEDSSKDIHFPYGKLSEDDLN